MADQPATLSTAFVITTCSMQHLQDGPIIRAAIVLLSIAGELLRPGDKIRASCLQETLL